MIGFNRKGLRTAGLCMLGALFAASIAAPVSAHAQPRPHQQAPASAGENTAPNGAVPEKEAEAKDENYEYTHSETVVKLGHALGMSPDTASTVFTVFNFLVLVIAVGYGVLKTLPKAFRKRSSDIQKHLVDARTATEEANARLNSVENRLAKLDEQIAEMKKHAEADIARDEARIKASLEDEKLKIVQAAEVEVLAATAAARREIQKYAAELAIDQAARKLVVTAETDRLLVENFARRLGADIGGQN